MTIVARKGDPVVCSKGHVNGHVLKDIADSDVLKPGGKFFGLDDAARTMTANMDGHLCLQCGERVMELHKGGYRIRTAAGWIGKVEP
jgi:hypothetical protein